MRKHVKSFGAAVLMFVITVPAAAAAAADDFATLRQQLAEQRALIQSQQRQLERQAKEFERLSRRIEEMAAGNGKTESAPAVVAAPRATPVDAGKGVSSAAVELRDSVGDLNNAAVQAGDFPGAFKIPGSKDVSLAIGGFIKTIAIADSKAEATGSALQPAYLGTKRPDTRGAFSLDPTLSRVFIDGRAPAGDGQLRAYFEGDLNNTDDGKIGLNMRHAYGSWRNSYGTLLAGHTWSTMMDLKVLPEGLTEPTVSGAIYVRQPQIRWSQPINPSFTLHAALEDPSSTDVFDPGNNPNIDKTKFPDGILGFEYERKDVGHLRLNSIVRSIRVRLPNGGEDDKAAWGLALTGHLKVAERDRWMFSGIYGQGLGRYLLGIQSTAGSAVDPLRNELVLRDNWGAMTTYQHHWTEKMRSNVMIGHAKANLVSWQDSNSFESTNYFSTNLLWSVFPYLTMGIEYAFAQRKNGDGSDFDNHRIALGLQFY